MRSESFPKYQKYITFPLANYWCVVPVAEILKIVNCPSFEQGGVVELGVVQLGPHTIQLLDLYQLFEGATRTKTSTPSTCLIVLQAKNKALWGILLETLPDLIELLPTDLKPVSLDEHFTTHSPWISHVGVLSKSDDSRTFLQLDLMSMLQQSLETHQRPRLTTTG